MQKVQTILEVSAPTHQLKICSWVTVSLMYAAQSLIVRASSGSYLKPLVLATETLWTLMVAASAFPSPAFMSSITQSSTD